MSEEKAVQLSPEFQKLKFSQESCTVLLKQVEEKAAEHEAATRRALKAVNEVELMADELKRMKKIIFIFV